MAPRPLPRAAISASSSSFVSCLLPAPRSAVSCSSRRAAVSQSGVSPGGAKLRICHFSPRRSEGAARPELGRAGAGASSSRGRAPAAVEWRCRERRKPAAGEKTCQVWFIMENTLLRLFFLDHGSLDLLRLVKAVGKNMGCVNYKQKMVSFQQRVLLSLPFRLFISFVLLLGSCASPC